MEYGRQRVVAALAVGLAVLASVLAYPDLPDAMATHWTAGGDVDGTMPKRYGALAVPAVMLVVAVTMYVAPRVDPRRRRYAAFRGTYEWFVAGVLVFLGYVHGLVLAWNLGASLPVGAALAPAVGAVVYGTGVLLDRAESNWFVGIRTPWTLSDEEVWEETHRRGALAFKLAGVLAAGGLFAPEYFLALVVAPVVAAAAYAVAYSFLAYRRKHGPA